MKIKLLSYTDEFDNTKGTLCALNADADLADESICDAISRKLGEMFVEDPMELYEIARQICHFGKSEHHEYSLYFEETELLEI